LKAYQYELVSVSSQIPVSQRVEVRRSAEETLTQKKLRSNPVTTKDVKIKPKYSSRQISLHNINRTSVSRSLILKALFY